MDNNSTTQVDPRVVERMLPFLSEEYGNAASVTHSFGQQAGAAVEAAREQVSRLLSCSSKEIVFTSGATESNNLALFGVMKQAPAGSHLIVNAAEHKAILDPAKQLERDGFQLTVLPVDEYGMLEPTSVSAAIQRNTVLVSAMFANNEVGSITPIAEIGSICRDAGVLFHTDATQAVGKVPINLDEFPVDLLSLSAHKMYGPKGIGALFVRRQSPRLKLQPIIYGGGQEMRFRSGTLPVHQIIGLGEACQLCGQEMYEELARTRDLTLRLRNQLESCVPNIFFNGHPQNRLPGNLHVTFEGANSDALMNKLKDVVAVSSGSACTTADPEPSHVLLAMGIDENRIDESIRFGIGRFNDEQDIERVSTALANAVETLRNLTAAF
jgi:cysteine desulfurase